MTEIRSAATLELKAELLRSLEKFKQDKQLADQGFPTKKFKKSTVKSNAGIDSRKARDYEISKTVPKEEVEALKLSQQKLSWKASLYEDIRKGKRTLEEVQEILQTGGEPVSGSFKRPRFQTTEEDSALLVDFDAKQDNIQLEEGSEKDNNDGNEEEENNEIQSGKDDDWIDFTDEFGRSRTIRKSELKEGQVVGMVSKDMLREAERLNWEKQAMEESGPNYFDETKEIRQMGAGFYRFAKNEETRLAQQAELQNLRMQTEKERQLHTSVKNNYNMRLKARWKMLEQCAAKQNKKELLYSEEVEKFFADVKASTTII